MNTDFEKLKAHLAQIGDLQAILSLCYWDQGTYLPESAHEVRAAQISTLTHQIHKLSVDPELGKTIEKASRLLKNLDPQSDEASLIRVAARDFERLTQVPDSFMAEMSQHFAETYSVWAKAREANDFSLVCSRLEKVLELSRRHAAFFKGFEEPLDALIEGSDPGMKSSEIRQLFSELRTELIPLMSQIRNKSQPPSFFEGKKFSIEAQKEISRKILTDIGFPWNRSRMDDTHHPFMIRMGANDCRITIRASESNPMQCISSAVHEAGHALYELGVSPQLDRTPLGTGTSMSLHESQSRFWENIIGRSRAFWQRYYPHMKAHFPEALSQASFQDLFQEVTRVSPSLIRVDADEVTYNLHVMIRFDLEADMLSGKLAVKDLPEAWNARYESDLGLKVPSDSWGCLQDMHWYSGGVGGYFQSYTLGNIMSGMFLELAEKDIPSFWKDVEKGEFGSILGWLKTHIHQHGRKFTTHELLKKMGCEKISPTPFIRYLKRKYIEESL